MRFNSTFAFVLATVTIAACGGDDGGVTAIDARRIDSGSGGPDAAATCDLPAGISLGEGTGIDFQRQDGMTAGHYTLASGLSLGSDMPPTVMFVEFYNDYAPFGTSMAPGAVAPGTYTIDATQSNYASCGACMRIFTKYVQGMPSTFNQTYMPNGGTITINSVTPTVGGTIDVTFTNLTLRQVTIATDGTFETTDVAGGCTSTISDGHFTGAVVAPAKRGNGFVYRLELDQTKRR